MSTPEEKTFECPACNRAGEICSICNELPDNCNCANDGESWISCEVCDGSCKVDWDPADETISDWPQTVTAE